MSSSINVRTGWYGKASCQIDDFHTICSQATAAANVPFAAEIQKNIPIYDAPALADALKDGDQRHQLMEEWADVLLTGAGAMVIRDAQPDHHAIDEATAIFERIIAEEKAASGEKADHFAKAGANDRIWNSLQKLCLTAPETFLRYHAVPIIDAVCIAWLGPGYQMTAQVNVVRPGGAAQQGHRDYHLGFQTMDQASSYPAHVHHLSPIMTLQGGISHCEIPIEAGPTKLLPFSQIYGPGYIAYHQQEFADYFEEHFVQLPLNKGDAIFFNPAIVHAGGQNLSADIQRLVNLLQVSSPLGRSLENINRTAMCKALYESARKSDLDKDRLAATIACCAEGYPFPTNLDSDPPVGGLAPENQNALFHRALTEQMDLNAFIAELEAMRERQSA